MNVETMSYPTEAWQITTSHYEDMAKNPKTKDNLIPPKRKEPKAQDAQEFMQLKPTWRLGLLEMSTPWGWANVDTETLIKIHRHLCELERLTWHEIMVVRRDSNHKMDVEKLCPDAQKRLIELRLDDIDELFSIRIGKARRIWGIREAAILKLLWWDPEHQVYPMNITNN